MNLVLYSLSLFGFCYGLGQSALTLPIRVYFSRWNWMKWPLTLIECPACLSYWIGTLVAFIWPTETITIAGPVFGSVLVFSFLSAGIAAVIGLFTGIME